jgi:hypothetical protein
MTWIFGEQRAPDPRPPNLRLDHRFASLATTIIHGKETLSMIYELRVYRALPGRMPNMLARFRDHTVKIWETHGIRALGFWTTLIGESNNELTYILPWESLADREAKWTAFLNDPAWHKARDDSERDGPIVLTIRNEILTPTAFSALK